MKQTRSLSQFTWCPKLLDFTLAYSAININPDQTAPNLISVYSVYFHDKI